MRELTAGMEPMPCNTVWRRDQWLELGEAWSVAGMRTTVGFSGGRWMVERNDKENKIGSLEVA